MAFSCASQLIRQQSGSLAPTLYTYDSLGNQVKSTVLLDTSHPESVTGNRVNESESHYAQEADGIYSITTSTRYNAEGTALTSIQKSLISRLSGELESKVITINERSLTSAEETRYTDSLMERLVSSTVPTSDTVATATVVDGFTIEQSDHQDGNWSFTRNYNATGILSTATDPRGITTSTQTDIAARPIIQTDGEGNETSISYISCCDSPATITDALGNTINYSYDIRNRKIAEFGTGIQPATYSYDDADRLTTLRTFRVDNSTITTDPTGRTDGDTTTWAYHDATGLQLSKTFADGTQELSSYDALNKLVTITNARGLSQTFIYNSQTAELASQNFASSPERNYSYNHLGQLLSVSDETANPIQWSSEFYDSELALVYYNYRSYDSADGRWINRDLIAEQGGLNLYGFVGNKVWIFDVQGLTWYNSPGGDNISKSFMILAGVQEEQFKPNRSWEIAVVNFIKWVVSTHPPVTIYLDGSIESNMIKNSVTGKNVETFFEKKNIDKIFCEDWEPASNIATNFPGYNSFSSWDVFYRDVSRFLVSLPNGVVTFVASSSGDVKISIIEEEGKNYILATHQVTNVTLLKSFAYHITPESWNDTIVKNWTQIYLWDKKHECCKKQ